MEELEHQNGNMARITAPKPTSSTPETENLADGMGDQDKVRLAGEVLETYKADEESREQWLKNSAEWTRLYFQTQKAENPPWEGASDESFPLLTEAVNEFQARAFQALLPSQKAVIVKPSETIDKASKERAKRITLHMQHQLFVQDKTYRLDKDALLFDIPIRGSSFTKTFRNQKKARNSVKNVRAADLVIPYGIGPKDIDEVERKTEKFPMTVGEAEWRFEKGFFIEKAQPSQMGAESEPQEAHDQAMGLTSPFEPDLRQAVILEQHVVMDLGDGKAPYIVWVDKESEKLLRLVARWETDDDGKPINKDWYDSREPVEYFTHYMFLPNPDGFYGLGLGHVIGAMNTSVNKLLRMTIDAGTLANVGNMSGFVSNAIGVDKGEMELTLGAFQSIQATSEDLQKGFWTPNFPGPSNVIPGFIGEIASRAERASSNTDVLSGQTESVQQPTTVLALIDQGLQLFSSVFERITESWTRELQKYYRLNRLFLDEAVFKAVLDLGDNPKAFQVARGDYADDLQVRPTADPKQVTERQALIRAQTVLETVRASPVASQDPEILIEAEKRFYEAIGVKDIEGLLPKPDRPQRVDDPNIENVMFFDPAQIPPDVFPDQDHDFHIQEHAAILESEEFTQFAPPERLEALQVHLQRHNAMRLQNAQGSTEPVEEPQNNNLGLAQVIGTV